MLRRSFLGMYGLKGLEDAGVLGTWTTKGNRSCVATRHLCRVELLDYSTKRSWGTAWAARGTRRLLHSGRCRAAGSDYTPSVGSLGQRSLSSSRIPNNSEQNRAGHAASSTPSKVRTPRTSASPSPKSSAISSIVSPAVQRPLIAQVAMPLTMGAPKEMRGSIWTAEPGPVTRYRTARPCS